MFDAQLLELFLALFFGATLWLGWALRGLWDRLGPRPEQTSDAEGAAPTLPRPTEPSASPAGSPPMASSEDEASDAAPAVAHRPAPDADAPAEPGEGRDDKVSAPR
ncbi:MAG: hypothetical protein AAF371_05060 [Pseudomonadota bacterium]